MKEEKIKQVIWLIGILLLVSALFLGVPMITTNVLGANISNQTVLAKVWVWNTEPNITSLTVSPSSINLNAGNITIVNCTAIVFDYNGWKDIANVTATFYDTRYGDGIVTDNKYRYINSSCGNCTDGGSPQGTNATCTCTFAVWYYANNGTWECNMTVTDGGGNATTRIKNLSDSQIASATVNVVVGINVPDELDYGNLSVTELSDNKSLNITNWGNVPINISIRGYGGTDESYPKAGNYSMVCQYGNITHGYQRYSLNATPYADMLNLTNTSTGLSNLKVQVRNDSSPNIDINTTYWRLEIPYSVGGYCNGTIVFSAAQDN